MSRPIAYQDDLVTLEEYLSLREPLDHRLEVSRGRLVREPGPASLHGRVQARLAAALVKYEEESGAGATLDNTAYILSENPATVRIPDLSFVRRERVPPGGWGGWIWRLAPDLAIEVLSPSNRPSDIQEKIVDYLEAGVRLIWIVDPESRTATVHRPKTDPRILREPDTLDAGDLLAGLAVPLAGIFRP